MCGGGRSSGNPLLLSIPFSLLQNFMDLVYCQIYFLLNMAISKMHDVIVVGLSLSCSIISSAIVSIRHNAGIKSKKKSYCSK